jgi:hypothetical protein
MGPLDNPWNVGHHKGPEARKSHDAKVRSQCGEGIVGNLGMGLRDGGKKGRLSGIGLADQAHVCDEFQLEFDSAFLPLFSRLPPTGSLVGGCGESGISPTTSPPPGHDEALPPLHQFAKEFRRVRIPDHGTGRNPDFDVLPSSPRAIASFSVLASLGFEMLLASEIE